MFLLGGVHCTYVYLCICIYVHACIHIYVYVVLKDVEAMIAEIEDPGSNESQILEAPWTPLRVCLCS